jgi:hypothetical protein
MKIIPIKNASILDFLSFVCRGSIITALRNDSIFCGSKCTAEVILLVIKTESSQVHSTSGKIFDRNSDGDFNISGNHRLVACF